MILNTGEVVIHDGNYRQFVNPTVNGETKRCGTVPRDYSTHPRGCYAAVRAVDFPVYAQSDWSALLQQQTADLRRCSDFRNRGMGGKPVPSRDQNGKGYCWAHSGVSAHLVARARDGQPYADLSAFSIACPIKNFQDEGGWGAQGVDYQIQNGVATAKTWPQQSMDRACVQASAQDRLRYKIVDGWIDMAAAQYDRNLSWAQYVTLWLDGFSTVNDYNWWSHSVCGIDLVDGATAFAGCRAADSGKLLAVREFERYWDMAHPVTGGFGCRIWNSWGDSWSQNGTGVLAPGKCEPDGGVGLRTVAATDPAVAA